MENDLTCLSNKGKRNNKHKINVIFQTINQLIDRSIQKVRFPQSFSFTAYEMIKQYRLTDIPVRKALIHIFK